MQKVYLSINNNNERERERERERFGHILKKLINN